METMPAVIAIAAQHKWKLYQMDVKSTLLNGVLKEEVYVEHPPSYELVAEEHKVYRLNEIFVSSSKLQGHGIVGLTHI